MTQDEILKLPLNKLPKACAEMMNLKYHDPGDTYFYVDFNYASEPYYERFAPQSSLDDARYVACFVVNVMSERTGIDAETIRFRIYKALQLVMNKEEEDGRSWNLLFHKPAELTRACLLTWYGSVK